MFDFSLRLCFIDVILWEMVRSSFCSVLAFFCRISTLIDKDDHYRQDIDKDIDSIRIRYPVDIPVDILVDILSINLKLIISPKFCIHFVVFIYFF